MTSIRSLAFLLVIFAALSASLTSGFSVPTTRVHPSHYAAPTTLAVASDTDSSIHPKGAVVAAAALLSANILPWMALAEDENYVYGAVDAPPLVPIIGGVLAILTALLPIALRGGEEAFEEMKEKDGFGSGKDQLKKRK
jgi:hypothetical protein